MPKQTTPNGKTVTTFSIATKTSYMKGGDRQSRTEWRPVQALGQTWRIASALKKGSHICVEGELRSREYESNGAKVRTYEILANSIMNLRAGQRCARRAAEIEGWILGAA